MDTLDMLSSLLEGVGGGVCPLLKILLHCLMLKHSINLSHNMIKKNTSPPQKNFHYLRLPNQQNSLYKYPVDAKWMMIRIVSEIGSNFLEKIFILMLWGFRHLRTSPFISQKNSLNIDVNLIKPSPLKQISIFKKIVKSTPNRSKNLQKGCLLRKIPAHWPKND